MWQVHYQPCYAGAAKNTIDGRGNSGPYCTNLLYEESRIPCPIHSSSSSLCVAIIQARFNGSSALSSSLKRS